MTYDSRDFVSRNRDALDRELSQAMYECDHPILKVLFPEGKETIFKEKKDNFRLQRKTFFFQHLKAIPEDRPGEDLQQLELSSKFPWQRYWTT